MSVIALDNRFMLPIAIKQYANPVKPDNRNRAASGALINILLVNEITGYTLIFLTLGLVTAIYLISA